MLSRKTFYFPHTRLLLHFTIQFLQQGVHLLTNSWPPQIHGSTYHTEAFYLYHLYTLLVINCKGYFLILQFLDFSLKLTLWSMTSSFIKFSCFILFSFWIFHLNQFLLAFLPHFPKCGVSTSENLTCHSVYCLWANLATPIFSSATFMLITPKEMSAAQTNVEKCLTP